MKTKYIQNKYTKKIYRGKVKEMSEEEVKIIDKLNTHFDKQLIIDYANEHFSTENN